MSNTDEIDNNLIHLCSGILDEIEEDIDARERELQLLFEQLSSQDFKYSDKKFIAEGGMKIISRVKDSASLRSVAIAELRKKDLNPDKILNFYNEARVTALLEHPNIVPIYEIGHHDGMPYFSMKEIQGETLGSILKKLKTGNNEYTAKYTIAALLSILLKVCDAISYAHSRKVVHLDLKPDNIHVGEFGEVLVIDWGLAKNLDKDVVLETHDLIESEIDIDKTLDGFVKGTVGYMAPEQARGENNKKDERTDIYALGAILYSILTKSSPYSDEDIQKAVLLISQGAFYPIDESKYPQALCAVVNKAMEIKQTDRYQHVFNFSQEIERYLQGFATNAQEAGLKDLITLFIKRNLVTSSLIFGFTIILSIGGYVSILNIKEEQNLASRSALQAIENEKQAKKNELEARASEKRALELFANLKQSKAENKKLEDLSLPLTIRRFYSFIHERDFKPVMATIDSIYRDDIPDENYWVLRSRALLGELRFSEAIENLYKAKTAPIKSPDHWKIDKFLQILDDGTSMTDRDPIEVIRLSSHFQRLAPDTIAHMFYTASTLIKGADKKAIFLKKALLKLNPELKSIHYKYELTPDGYDIDLSNNSELRNITPLTQFPIYKLNLSNCKNIESFIPIKNSDIQILDLSGIDSSYYRPHVHLKHLTRLYMRNCSFRYQWIIASTITYLDFTNSKVDLGGFRIKHLPNLNLCNADIMNIYKLNKVSGLTRVIVPKKFERFSGLFKNKKRGAKIFYCNCQKSDCYKKFPQTVSKVE